MSIKSCTMSGGIGYIVLSFDKKVLFKSYNKYDCEQFIYAKGVKRCER